MMYSGDAAAPLCEDLLPGVCCCLCCPRRAMPPRKPPSSASNAPSKTKDERLQGILQYRNIHIKVRTYISLFMP
jgi:hypothetical protein